MLHRLLISLVLVLAACTVGENSDGEHATHEDVEAGIVVLEGEALADELSGSPSRRAGADFVRLGVIYDAEAPGALELSTSEDGETWSEWRAPVVHHVEHESTAAFVGQLELPPDETARYYRLRGRASFVRLEEMVFHQSDNIESGDDTQSPSIELSVGDSQVEPRSSWGARTSRCSSSLGKVYRMALHHTESPTVDSLSPEARLRQIQSYHMDVKGWCDIGYHYLVSRDGRIWQGRPVEKLGSHAGGANTGNVGISVMGKHDTTPVTDVQVAAIARLVRNVAERSGLAITRSVVKGHREYKSTSCPGDRLLGQLDEILEIARSGESVGNPEEPVEEPPPSTPNTVTVRGVLYAGSDPSQRISGATVRIGAASVVTDSTGAWELQIAPGGFTVSATKAGFVGSSISRTTSGDVTWASFGLAVANAPTGTAILQGVVYFSSDSQNRIPFASVTLSTGHTITADANGYYKLTGLPPGTVTITATAGGSHGTASVSRTLANGVTEWGSVRLAP
jgi:hypothetical protein